MTTEHGLKPLGDLFRMQPNVYRLYDARQGLLYVGMSVAPPQLRWASHASDKWWWSEVAYVDVRFYDTEREAAVEEIMAIWVEVPKYNREHAASQLHLGLLPPLRPPAHQEGGRRGVLEEARHRYESMAAIANGLAGRQVMPTMPPRSRLEF